jgi:hypothetical protein
MNFSGNNILSISHQTGISFLINFYLNNITGQCDLGFSEIDQRINFKFKDGKIFDPENKLIYTYNANENIKLSGNINLNGYDYYINDYYLSNLNLKKYNKFNEFYLNLSEVLAFGDVYINGDKPNYKINFNNFYYVKEYLSGSISGNNELNFKIYSGEIIYPLNSNFVINTIPNFNENISGKKYDIIINPDINTTKDFYLDQTGKFTFGLYTNFGKIYENFNLTSKYLTTGLINNFNINQISKTFFTEIGQTNKDHYVLFLNFNLGNETGVYPIDKSLDIEFSYASGITGITNCLIPINTTLQDSLTGYLIGSGYLTKTITGIGTGINLITNQLVTGLISQQFSEFNYLNGDIINNVKFLASGGKIYNKIISGDINDSFFGNSVKLNSEGNIAIIGAPRENDLTGKAYIFTGLNNNWNKFITFSGENQGDLFGYSVSSNKIGDKFAIGAYNNNLKGAVYIFTGNNNQWNYQKLDGGMDSVNFGRSICFNKEGNIIFIGGKNNYGTNGTVWIFTGNNLNYTLKQKISSPNSTEFGYSIDSNDLGNVFVVGDPYLNSGAAWILTGNQTSWSPAKIIYGTNNANRFGSSVSIDGKGNNIIVGADYSNNYSGLAFLFTGSEKNWGTSKILSGNNKNYFGNSVSINSIGNKTIIGSYGSNDFSGAISIYSFIGNDWINEKEISGNNLSGNFGSAVSFNNSGNIFIIGERNASKSFISSDQFFINATGSISGFVENGYLNYNNIYTLNYFDSIYTGYIGTILASGFYQKNKIFTLTKNQQSQYIKSFSGSFNIITGYSNEYFNFRENNMFYNNKYKNNSLIKSNINEINIIIEKKNFYDNNIISGDLLITGYLLDFNIKSGIKIPIVYSGER